MKPVFAFVDIPLTQKMCHCSAFVDIPFTQKMCHSTFVDIPLTQKMCHCSALLQNAAAGLPTSSPSNPLNHFNRLLSEGDIGKRGEKQPISPL
ncbi:hypothetical protein [Cohnella soli]|uniref:Uncharacterized protein n=1 Tax=Cohnella soli TaxID=425005 RepID=A0ABW0HNR3_9BACL